MENIILIGMPGVGKSTVGVLLAKVLGYQFVDSDLLIQKEEGKFLYEIIEEKGADAFKEIESKITKSIHADHAVIATGGSAVYSEDAMNYLKSTGKVVYLKISLENLKKRILDANIKNVLKNKNQNLKNIYEERLVLYEKYADIIIEVDDLNFAECLNAVVISVLNKDFRL